MEETGRHHHQHQVLASLVTEETQARVRTAAPALLLSPWERGVAQGSGAWPRGVGRGPGEWGMAPPTPQRAPVTMALRGLAPDALWLAHPDAHNRALPPSFCTSHTSVRPSVHPSILIF